MSSNIANIVIKDLKQFTHEAILKNNYSKEIGNSCANATIKCIQLNFKNRLIYVPFMSPMKAVKEKQQIKDEFNGANHADLAIKYQRSLQNIYRILKDKEIKKPKRPILIKVIEDYLPKEFMTIGLSEQAAQTITNDIGTHLQQTFPGISFYCSEDTIKNSLDYKVD